MTPTNIANSCLEFVQNENNEYQLVERAPMIIPRIEFATVATSDHIYVLGGLSLENETEFCEKYSIASNTWTSVCSLLSPRAGLSACLVDGILIYAFGGATQSNGPYRLDYVYPSPSIVRLFIGEDQWECVTLLSGLYAGSYNAGICVTNENQILLFGGAVPGSQLLNSGSYYKFAIDPRSSVQLCCNELGLYMNDFEAFADAYTVLDGDVYALSTTSIYSAYILFQYRTATKTWITPTSANY